VSLKTIVAGESISWRATQIIASCGTPCVTDMTEVTIINAEQSLAALNRKISRLEKEASHLFDLS
jgi:hypothetical protein